MRLNLAELPEFLRLAASLGVDRVNAPNLDFIPTPEMEPLSLCSPAPPDSEIAAFQRQAEAEVLKTPFRNLSLYPNYDLRVCDANPLSNAFVTASGEVAPCVYLGLPLAGSFTRYWFNQSYQASNYSYGNVLKRGFYKLSQQPAYLNFIDYFRGPAEIFNLLHSVGDDKLSPCQGCLKSLGF